MMSTKGKIFEVYVFKLLGNSFWTLFLTAEIQFAHGLSATAAIFLLKIRQV